MHGVERQMCEKKQRVVVVGASPKPERYSNRAMRLLIEHGHEAIPVHPAVEKIEGVSAVKSLAEITDDIDTVTLYVSAAISSSMQDALLEMRPKRVIFNPGAENAPLRDALESNGIQTLEACTLVLLNIGRFS